MFNSRRYIYKPVIFSGVNEGPEIKNKNIADPGITNNIISKIEEPIIAEKKSKIEENNLSNKLDMQLIEDIITAKIDKIEKALIDYKLPFDDINEKLNCITSKSEELLKRKRKKDEEKYKEKKNIKDVKKKIKLTENTDILKDTKIDSISVSAVSEHS